MEKEKLSIPIYSSEGKELDTVNLDTKIFDGTVNEAAIYQAINTYRANKRSGSASTKTRGEVSGGGKKPWRQKGTGRARVGSSRSPLWRHGGVIFGPHPRDFSYTIPEKLKLEALRSSINSRIKNNDMVVIDNIKIDSPKTKEMVKVLDSLKIKEKCLFVLESVDKNTRLSSRNIDFLNVMRVKDINAYSVLECKKLLLTKEGLKAITSRIKGKNKSEV